MKYSKQIATTELISDPELKALANKLCRHGDDLIQEVALQLLEMPDDKWQEINEGGYLRFYVVRTIMNMATSKRSAFAKKYNLFNTSNELPEQIEPEGYDHEKESDLRTIETLLTELHWYDKKVLEMYIEEGSYRKVAAKVGIPYKSIGNTVKRSLKTLRNNYYGIHLERLIREHAGYIISRRLGNRPQAKEPSED